MTHAELVQGHGEPCYYCGDPCNGLTGNPGWWPVGLCHPDDPGVVKWHHESCVTERLHRTETALPEQCPMGVDRPTIPGWRTVAPCVLPNGHKEDCVAAPPETPLVERVQTMLEDARAAIYDEVYSVAVDHIDAAIRALEPDEKGKA